LALIVEGAGAIVGGATSSSSNTVIIESGAGIEEGARTGLANLVTGVLFLAAMFVAPLASIVPTEVAAAALVIVGVMMMSQLRHIDISEFSVALLDRQRHRRRLHRVGRPAHGGRQRA
jgi:AGZA family xanthine/uracil permease-like MFS transporter